MTRSMVKETLIELVAAMEKNPESRSELHPRLLDLIARMEAEGLQVPIAVQELERAICEEEADQMFDNLPV